MFVSVADEGSASGDDKEPEREYSQPVIHPPGEVTIGTGQVPAKQVVCGLHHTGKALINVALELLFYERMWFDCLFL